VFPAICGFHLPALALSRAADTVSVIIRGSLLQPGTPPEMQGRIRALNSPLVGAENALGEFENGLTVQWWGAVHATVTGGNGSLVIADLWTGLFPVSVTPASLAAKRCGRVTCEVRYR
jgi:hypothetical protein